MAKVIYYQDVYKKYLNSFDGFSDDEYSDRLLKKLELLYEWLLVDCDRLGIDPK